jgi:hypothetical protein
VVLTAGESLRIGAADQSHDAIFCVKYAGTHDILKPYSSDGMAAQLYFTADAPDSRFFQSWDLDLVFDVLQVCYMDVLQCYIAVLLYMIEAVYQTRELLVQWPGSGL